MNITKQVTAAACLTTLLLSGCATKNQVQPHQGITTTNTANELPGHVKSVQNPYNQNYDAKVDGKRPLAYTEDDVRSAIFVAKRVASIAKKVPGVTRASAAAQGIDIVVGIDGDGKVSGSQLEQEVLRKTQSAEPGYNIYVTSDPKLHNTIRYMNTSMTNVRSHQVTKGISRVIYEIGRQSAGK